MRGGSFRSVKSCFVASYRYDPDRVLDQLNDENQELRTVLEQAIQLLEERLPWDTGVQLFVADANQLV